MAILLQDLVIINDNRELIGVNTAGITTALYVGETIQLDAQSGVITATKFVGSGASLTDLPPGSFIADAAPTTREDGSPLQEGDIYYDSSVLRQFTRYDNDGDPIWVDSNPAASAAVLSVNVGVDTALIDLTSGKLIIEGTADEVTVGINTLTDTVTIGLPNDVSIASTMTAAFFEGDGSKLTNISGGSIDLSGTYQNLGGLNVSGPGIAVTVTNDVSIGGTVIATTYYGSLEGNVTGNLSGDSTGNHNGDVYSRDGSQLVLEVPASSGDAHYIGTVTGDVTGDLTGDSFGTHTGQQNGDVYTADGATLVVDTAAAPAPVFKGDAEGLTGVPNISVANVGASGSITAVSYFGDGSNLSGLVVGAAVSVTSFDNQDNVAYPVPFLSALGVGATIYTDSTTNEELTYNPSTGTLESKEFNALSDQRLKTNISGITSALYKLEQLRGVEYDWVNGSGSSVGVIAQEVQSVYPQLVVDSENRMTVNYNGLVGLLVQAVNELAVLLDEYKSK